MRVWVGPAPPSSARAWIGWARDEIGALRRAPGTPGTLPTQVLDNIEAYVDAWAGAGNGETFHWQADVDPDQLEYLTNSLHDLDLRLADRARQYPGRAEPTEGVEFHVVLVEALLNALAQEGPSHAAFAEQLRREWPVVTATTS